MKFSMFSIPVFEYQVNDWQNKKNQISNYINESLLTRGEHENFYSDRHTNNNSYLGEFNRIFQDELDQFFSDLGTVGNIIAVWKVNYTKGDFHQIHNHGSTGYSGIIYFDYDDEVHTPTQFVDTDNDPITDRTRLACNQGSLEGDIVIVPSKVLHFTYPNNSDKLRSILGFDIRF